MQHCSWGHNMKVYKGGLRGWEVGALAWGFTWPLRAFGGQGPRPFKKEPVLCPRILAPYLQPNMPTLASPHEVATLLHCMLLTCELITCLHISTRPIVHGCQAVHATSVGYHSASLFKEVHRSQASQAWMHSGM